MGDVSKLIVHMNGDDCLLKFNHLPVIFVRMTSASKCIMFRHIYLAYFLSVLLFLSHIYSPIHFTYTRIQLSFSSKDISQLSCFHPDLISHLSCSLCVPSHPALALLFQQIHIIISSFCCSLFEGTCYAYTFLFCFLLPLSSKSTLKITKAIVDVNIFLTINGSFSLDYHALRLSVDPKR